jgi:hypothetical protein
MLIKLVFLLVGLRTLNEEENNGESRVEQKWKVGAYLKVHTAYFFCLSLKQLWVQCAWNFSAISFVS